MATKVDAARKSTTTLAQRAMQWTKDHPVRAGLLGSSAAVVAFPALFVGPALGALGFGANGIVGGSIAAGAQAGIGNVVAPSLFATLQSAGASGYGLAAVTGAAQAVGAAGGIGALLAGKKKENKDGEDDDAGNEKKDGGDGDAGKVNHDGNEKHSDSDSESEEEGRSSSRL